MHSDKRNSIMALATGLISWEMCLFAVAALASWFYQSLRTFVLFCAHVMASVQELGKCGVRGAFIVFFALNVTQSV